MVSCLFSALSMLLSLSTEVVIILTVVAIILTRVYLLFGTFCVFYAGGCNNLRLFICLYALRVVPLLLTKGTLIRCIWG